MLEQIMPVQRPPIEPRPAVGAGQLTVAGLFAGIGGFELGFRRAGLEAQMLCESNDDARAVLKAHFAELPVVGDVTRMKRLPPVEVVVAGFPCADLSPAGRLEGIAGPESGLVEHVFRLLKRRGEVRWLILENVPFMLQLYRGAAMAHVIRQLEEMGFTWAYRVVDARAFGLPQRRRRVIIVASRSEDPSDVLLCDNAESRILPAQGKMAGFYWTEGSRGKGWTVEGIPTLKGSSGLGIASPPAIWNIADDALVTPDIRDAERLQGFPSDWTRGARSPAARWRLVGNAVSVPVARWLGRRLRRPGAYSPINEELLKEDARWPNAGRGGAGERFAVRVSEWPVQREYRPLSSFLRYPTTPLSRRAAAGFLKRASASRLRFDERFLAALNRHVEGR